MLTRAEKVELGLIALATGALVVFAEHLPVSLELGSLMAVSALALLGQGLVRDVWLLIRQRRAGGTTHVEEARCMCVESTVGLSGVLAGVVLTAVGVPVAVSLPAWVWPVSGALVWLGGFAMKDFVIQWSPWGLRRVKNHGSILVRWR